MNNTDKTLQDAEQARADALAKAYSQSASATSGLTSYDLSAPAKTLFPKMTPLVNRIARVSGGMGIQANWRAVTGVSVSPFSAGIAQGKRGGVVTQSTADYLAAFKGYGRDQSVTFEAELAGKGFEDIRARAAMTLLNSVKIEEEMLDLGGLGTFSLGTTPTPTLSQSATGGTLGAATYSVICIALSHSGLQQVVAINNGQTGQTGAVVSSSALQPTITVTSGAGETTVVNGGLAQKSSNATIVVASGSTNKLTATVADVPGAAGYAWFLGTATNEVLTAISTINKIDLVAAGVSTQLASSIAAADTSKNDLVYDGLWAQIAKSGSGSYVKSLDGAALTSDSAGGIVEIDDALFSFYQLNRLSPDTMYVGPKTFRDITKKVIANNGAPLIRYNGDFNGSNSLSAGTMVVSYLNKITGDQIKIEVHPNMPEGNILFYTETLPYALSNVGNVVQKLLRRDYYQLEWPLRTRTYESGVYCDGVLQCFFTPALGLLKNFAV